MDFRARFAQCYCGSAIIGMSWSVYFVFFTGRHNSGSSPKAGCLCSLEYKPAMFEWLVTADHRPSVNCVNRELCLQV